MRPIFLGFRLSGVRARDNCAQRSRDTLGHSPRVIEPRLAARDTEIDRARLADPHAPLDGARPALELRKTRRAKLGDTDKDACCRAEPEKGVHKLRVGRREADATGFGGRVGYAERAELACRERFDAWSGDRERSECHAR